MQRVRVSTRDLFLRTKITGEVQPEILECLHCTSIESSSFTVSREAGRMKCPAAGQVSSSEPLTGSLRVLQWARVAVRVRGSSSQAPFTREGRASGGHTLVVVVEAAWGQVVAGCAGPWGCFMASTVLAPTPFLQLESAVSLFLVMNPVGCCLNLSFAKARSCVKTEMVFLFSLN